MQGPGRIYDTIRAGASESKGEFMITVREVVKNRRRIEIHYEDGRVQYFNDLDHMRQYVARGDDKAPDMYAACERMLYDDLNLVSPVRNVRFSRPQRLDTVREQL